MLKQASLSREPLIPFRNNFQQSRNHRNHMPLPTAQVADPVMAHIDVETALNYLFADGEMARPLPRNRFEAMTDWFNDVLTPWFSIQRYDIQ